MDLCGDIGICGGERSSQVDGHIYVRFYDGARPTPPQRGQAYSHPREITTRLRGMAAFPPPPHSCNWNRTWFLVRTPGLRVTVHLSGQTARLISALQQLLQDQPTRGGPGQRKSGHLTGRGSPSWGPLPAATEAERHCRGSPHNTLPHASWERWHENKNLHSSSTSNWRREAHTGSAALSRPPSGPARPPPQALPLRQHTRPDAGHRRAGRTRDRRPRHPTAHRPGPRAPRPHRPLQAILHRTRRPPGRDVPLPVRPLTPPHPPLRRHPPERAPHKAPQVPPVQILVRRFPRRVMPARQHLRDVRNAVLVKALQHIE